MFELFGTTYYFSGQGQMAYLFVYLPLVLVVVKLVKRLVIPAIPNARLKRALPAAIAVVLLSIPFIDVYQIGQLSSRLCKAEGDMRVYRTVEAEGFYGDPSIEFWSERGFSYTEYPIQVLKGKQYVQENRRATMRNGERQSKVVDKIQSRYMLGGNHNRNVDAYPSRAEVRWNIHSVSDRLTGEVLSDLVYFQIQPGRFDRLAINAIGFSFIPWFCGAEIPNAKGSLDPHSRAGRYSFTHLIEATIKPEK